MSNEMRELLTKAEQGDVPAMVNLGIQYDMQGNPQQAAYWWEKAADNGAVSGAFNLVYYIYGGHAHMPDSRKFIHWLEVLSDKFQHGWAKVILGSIYCGSEYVTNPVYSDILSADEIAALKNPRKGMELIDEGVTLAEESNKHPPLTFQDYFMIGEAYRAYENFEVDYVQKALMYHKKAFALYPPDYPNEMREPHAKIIESLANRVKPTDKVEHIKRLEEKLRETIQNMKSASELLKQNLDSYQHNQVWERFHECEREATDLAIELEKLTGRKYMN